ncbi:MAG: hypothetical protein ACHQ50_09540 [Fimbriimonadales bacterium]
MRYFVIAPDGSKYGPADIAMLRAWIAEGRIAPDTILEEAASRQRVPARMVAGLSFNFEAPSFAPPTTGGRGRPEFGAKVDDGSYDLLWSYICSALTIICCLPFIIGGFVYANRALSKGNRRGKVAKIFAWIMLSIWIISTPIEIAFLRQIIDYFQHAVGGTGGLSP